MRYFFDLRDGAEIARDEEGLDLDSPESVRDEAARALVELAKDAMGAQ